MERLDKYEHYLAEKAELDCEIGMNKLYKITTINWTVATENDVSDYDKVHRNEYTMSLESFIQFIRDTEEVWEDVVSIEKIV